MATKSMDCKHNQAVVDFAVNRSAQMIVIDSYATIQPEPVHAVGSLRIKGASNARI